MDTTALPSTSRWRLTSGAVGLRRKGGWPADEGASRLLGQKGCKWQLGKEVFLDKEQRDRHGVGGVSGLLCGMWREGLRKANSYARAVSTGEAGCKLNGK